MELIRGAHNLRPHHRGCVATIGNFDGVHLGHQMVLDHLNACARRAGVPATVIVFEPQPSEFFRPERAPARLSRLREKALLLKRCAIDRLVVMRFDAELAAESGEAFVDRILVRGLGVRYLVVGDDFKFGKQRNADFSILQNLAVRYGFEVDRTSALLSSGERVSSTAVRALLASGDLDDATQMLGRRYFIAGRVVHGKHNGRTIGFPTANVDLHRAHTALEGIFVVTVRGLGEYALDGVGYVGSRPIIADPKFVLETHIFDYDEDCYGRYIEVDFIAKLRSDVAFESFEALREQIALDCEHARLAHAARKIRRTT